MKEILDGRDGKNAEQIYANLHTYDEQFHSYNLQFQLKAVATSPFDMFPLLPFNMLILIISAKVSVTIDKIANIGHSYLIFLGSFSDSLYTVKVKRQEVIAKREAESTDIILIDWTTATTVFASEEEPDTVTGTTAFMNKILMVFADRMKKIERAPEKYSCGVNKTVDRLNLLHEAMISIPDNDSVGLFVI
ncbi:1470_t:CDS:2 [Funneliformis mosseae]|uniref:1470_t:CDS:1 n=1 Tax=Funneliformis mosseae TaxID=27381 RepID=A0A9N8WR38_FUNMO|nr:1470_t:CDS:2 [Funneliformis mosseae]